MISFGLEDLLYLAEVVCFTLEVCRFFITLCFELQLQGFNDVLELFIDGLGFMLLLEDRMDFFLDLFELFGLYLQYFFQSFILRLQFLILLCQCLTLFDDQFHLLLQGNLFVFFFLYEILHLPQILFLQFNGLELFSNVIIFHSQHFLF